MLLAKASIDKGKATAKQCQACHTFEKGGPNRVGPNLWGIVGEPRGKGRGGFAFSDAMAKKGGEWTFEELNKFLKDPRAYIPGTKMTFAGISRDQQRADVIDFLRTQSDNPLPLPKVAEARAGQGACGRRCSGSQAGRSAEGCAGGEIVTTAILKRSGRAKSPAVLFSRGPGPAFYRRCGGSPLAVDRKTDIISGDSVSVRFLPRAGALFS